MNAFIVRLFGFRYMLLNIWIGLCVTMVVDTVQASAGQVTFTGIVLESEAGTFLETEQGDFFVLKGIDARSFMDAMVVVTGDLGEDELGNDVILVRTIREDKVLSSATRRPATGNKIELQICDS
jgi:hypothetical protein